MTASIKRRLSTAIQVLSALALIIGSFAWLEGSPASAVTDNACSGAFSGASDEGIDLTLFDSDGDVLSDGSEVLVGETLTATVTWNPADWTGDEIDRVAACVSVAGVELLSISSEDKPSENDGEWTTTLVVPEVSQDLCVRARLSGNPSSQNDSTFKSDIVCFEVIPRPDEVCDGVDNDFDGDVDEGFDTNDDDGDGIPNCNDDIDDRLEVCDGVDNDGDGDVDEGFDTNDDDGDGIPNCNDDTDDSAQEEPCVGSVTVTVVDADTGELLEEVTVTIGDDSGTAPFMLDELDCTTITTTADSDTLPAGYELVGAGSQSVTLTEEDPDAEVVFEARGSTVLSGSDERPAPATGDEEPAAPEVDDVQQAADEEAAAPEEEAEVEELALTGLDSLGLAALAIALLAAGIGAERLTRRRDEEAQA